MNIVTGIVEHIASRRDNTLKMVIGLQEMHSSKAGELFALQNRLSLIAFKGAEFKDNEIEALESIDLDIEEVVKSPSKRLRNVFYRLWEQNNEGYTDFNMYYIGKMDMLIEHYKGKLI
jgi:hypothetical protein